MALDDEIREALERAGPLPDSPGGVKEFLERLLKGMGPGIVIGIPRRPPEGSSGDDHSCPKVAYWKGYANGVENIALHLVIALKERKTE